MDCSSLLCLNLNLNRNHNVVLYLRKYEENRHSVVSILGMIRRWLNFVRRCRALQINWDTAGFRLKLLHFLSLIEVVVFPFFPVGWKKEGDSLWVCDFKMKKDSVEWIESWFRRCCHCLQGCECKSEDFLLLPGLLLHCSAESAVRGSIAERDYLDYKVVQSTILEVHHILLEILSTCCFLWYTFR